MNLENRYLVVTPSGDRIVFDDIYHQYFNRLYKIAYAMVMTDDAKDIVQEVFLSMYNKKEMIFDSREALVGYLFQSVRNRAINFLRDMKISDTHQSAIIDAMLEWQNEGVTNEGEYTIFVRECMDQLTQQQKEILLLRVEGYSYKEIAEKMEIKVGTVNTHISRAYKLFRAKLPTIFIFATISIFLKNN